MEQDDQQLYPSVRSLPRVWLRCTSCGWIVSAIHPILTFHHHHHDHEDGAVHLHPQTLTQHQMPPPMHWNKCQPPPSPPEAAAAVAGKDGCMATFKWKRGNMCPTQPSGHLLPCMNKSGGCGIWRRTKRLAAYQWPAAIAWQGHLWHPGTYTYVTDIIWLRYMHMYMCSRLPRLYRCSSLWLALPFHAKGFN